MSEPGRDRRAGLPSVDRVLTAPAAAALIERHGRALVLDAVRRALAEHRAADAARLDRGNRRGERRWRWPG